MIKRTILPALVVLATAPGLALAAGGGGETKDVAFSFEGPFGTYDSHQLQRGFQVYHEVCAACHGLKFVAFRELGNPDGPAFPEEQVKAIAALYDVPAEIGQPYKDRDGEKYDAAEPGDTRPGKPSDKFPENTGAGAPDLSLMAKSRAGYHGPMGLGLSQFFNGIGGPEYIYSVLMGYTGDTEEVAGNVLYYNKGKGGNLSMSPPLEDDLIEYGVFGKVKDDTHGHAYEAPAATADQMAKDVSAFLMWTAEPEMVNRKVAGFRNLIMIILLAVLLYYTNKKLWAPVKRKS